MRRHGGAVLLLLAVSVPALGLRLATCPPVWLDEGIRMNAARTLIERGVYGTSSVEGEHPFDPRTTSGPVDQIAVAAGFRCLGYSTVAARLPMALLTLGAVLLLYAIAQWLWGRRVALLAVLAVLAMPSIQGSGLLFLGRQVMGEAPSLALALLSFWLLFQSWVRDRPWVALGSGAAAVLAFLSKGQTGIGLFPALAVGCTAYFALLPGGGRRGARWGSALALSSGAALVLCLWWLAQQALVSDELRRLHAATLLEQIQVQLVMAGPRKLSSGSVAVVALMGLGLVAGFASLAARRRARELDRARASAEITLVAFVAAVGLWFSGVSIGWPRYAYAGLVVAQLLIGRQAYPLLVCGCRALRRWRPITLEAAYRLAVIGISAVALALNLAPLRHCPPEEFARDVGEYVRSRIPPGAVIESVEWEVDALSGHWNYHHPAQSDINIAVRQLGAGVPFDVPYDVLQGDPDYLLTGPYSDWVRLYAKRATWRSFALLDAIGPYRVYKRIR